LRHRILLVALDSVGIDPLGINRQESVYFNSEFLFPKQWPQPIQPLVNSPVPGVLVETDVTDGRERGGIECALTYTSIFTGRSAVRQHDLVHSLQLHDGVLEQAVRESNLFKLFRYPCLANALFPAHLSFFRSSYVEDLLPLYSKQQVEEGLRFRGHPVRLSKQKQNGFAELFTLAEINQNIFVFAAREAGVHLRGYEDVRAGHALTSSMTNELENEFNLSFLGEKPLPIYTPQAAARMLARLVREHDFVFYKYQLADLVSHTGRLELARDVFAIMERFVRELLLGINAEETTVVVTSDHGHLEQVAYQRGHPKTRVPTWCFGEEAVQNAEVARKPEGIFSLLASLVG
jgi:hypothetical protein